MEMFVTVPVIVAIVISAMIRAWQDKTNRVPDALRVMSLSGIFVAVSQAWSFVSDCSIFSVWRLNLQNHEGFYGEFTRTWWKWALVNPIELVLSIGPIAAVMAAAAFVRNVRMICDRDARAVNSAVSVSVATVATLGLLWLSGKNQGEAARLWCFLTPWPLISAAGWLANGSGDKNWRFVLALQLVYCLIAVSRVNGFSF